jgi:hypothetical protein
MGSRGGIKGGCRNVSVAWRAEIPRDEADDDVEAVDVVPLERSPLPCPCELDVSDIAQAVSVVWGFLGRLRALPFCVEVREGVTGGRDSGFFAPTKSNAMRPQESKWIKVMFGGRKNRKCG